MTEQKTPLSDAEMVLAVDAFKLLQAKLDAALAAIKRLEQVSGELCEKCGWAFKLPNEQCRCEMEQEITALRVMVTRRDEVIAAIFTVWHGCPPDTQCKDTDYSCYECKKDWLAAKLKG